MSYNEAEIRFYPIDPAVREKWNIEHWKLMLETPVSVELTGAKGRRRPGAGRTDYLLFVKVGTMPKPLPVIEAPTFDLKAVNPRARVVRDTRSVGEIIDPCYSAHG